MLVVARTFVMSFEKDWDSDESDELETEEPEVEEFDEFDGDDE